MLQQLLTNQVAVITGGSAGIGKAIANQFALSQAKVIILGTNYEKGMQAVEEIKKSASSTEIHFFQVDVSNTSAVDQTIKQILETHKTIDILINNAGITRDQLLIRMSEEDWDQVLAVNAKSCYNTCRAVSRVMMKARKGIIINMSSVVGLTGNAGQVNYAASKAAIIGFTKALAKELAPRGIRVNCICPGFIDTAMTAALSEAQRTALLTQIPLGCLGTPDDIADMALFLGSPRAKYITGQVFVVDGGMTI